MNNRSDLINKQLEIFYEQAKLVSKIIIALYGKIPFAEFFEYSDGIPYRF